jgi:alkyl sulfatase BDS1-like metallo-beta-lactamase superfamily hydrolase
MRGFIGTVPDALVPGAGPRPAWSMKPYDFLKTDTPADTVNPSLWRQAQLNAIHGLFKVTDRVYQVRGFDLANMTIVEGDSTLIVIDPLLTAETARAALALYYQHRPRKPVGTVIYTHGHADHFGGVKGVVSEADVAAGKVQVIAPAAFMETAVAENILAGNAMNRRSQYQFGSLLPPGVRGQVDTGLGKALARGSVTLVAPYLDHRQADGERTIDGVQFEFRLVPGSEAPAEMLLYLPQFRVLNMAEDVTHTMHNLYTIRGAEVRDGNLWSKYIDEARVAFGDKADVLIAQHHWPTTGRERIVDLLKKQRDMYKFINDQTLRLLNQGYTAADIAETLRMPASLEKEWSARGYYGTLSHNAKAVYQKYLGWYDANPANLNPLAAGGLCEEDGRVHGRRQRGAGPRARRLHEGRVPLGGQRDEPGGVRRPVEPRGARAGRRCAGAAGLPGRGRHLAQRVPRRRDGVAQRRAEDCRWQQLERGHAQGGEQRPVLRLPRRAARRGQGRGQDLVINWNFTDSNQQFVLTLENSALTHVKNCSRTVPTPQ